MGSIDDDVPVTKVKENNLLLLRFAADEAPSRRRTSESAQRAGTLVGLSAGAPPPSAFAAAQPPRSVFADAQPAPSDASDGGSSAPASARGSIGGGRRPDPATPHAMHAAPVRILDASNP